MWKTLPDPPWRIRPVTRRRTAWRPRHPSSTARERLRRSRATSRPEKRLQARGETERQVQSWRALGVCKRLTPVIRRIVQVPPSLRCGTVVTCHRRRPFSSRVRNRGMMTRITSLLVRVEQRIAVWCAGDQINSLTPCGAVVRQVSGDWLLARWVSEFLMVVTSECCRWWHRVNFV